MYMPGINIHKYTTGVSDPDGSVFFRWPGTGRFLLSFTQKVPTKILQILQNKVQNFHNIILILLSDILSFFGETCLKKDSVVSVKYNLNIVFLYLYSYLQFKGAFIDPDPDLVRTPNRIQTQEKSPIRIRKKRPASKTQQSQHYILIL